MRRERAEERTPEYMRGPSPSELPPPMFEKDALGGKENASSDHARIEISAAISFATKHNQKLPKKSRSRHVDAAKPFKGYENMRAPSPAELPVPRDYARAQAANGPRAPSPCELPTPHDYSHEYVNGYKSTDIDQTNNAGQYEDGIARPAPRYLWTAANSALISQTDVGHMYLKVPYRV